MADRFSSDDDIPLLSRARDIPVALHLEVLASRNNIDNIH
jgi:hypothetical protein